ncbi:MAG: hypothetical protein JEZ10_08620 [Verrucomicrobia bacterium]|nr:hypothetical protein [Verrucomicrobiota bacterium]
MRTFIIMLMLAMIGSTASAQFNPFKNRQKTALTGQIKPEIDFKVEPSSAPTEDLNVNEFQLKRRELDGKVVELEFDRVVDLKQSGNGYTARVTFESGRLLEGVTLLIPEEGLELFKEMAERDARSPRRETVYVEVLGANISKALGTRYSKNKPEGERYTW